LNRKDYLYNYSKRPHAMQIDLIKREPKFPKQNQPALVFVHGAWHGAWCWEEHFIPFFTQNGYECYAFDLPNHGANKDKKGINKYRITDYVNHLELALAQINKPVVLIGHSMGGYIIQKYLEKNDCKGVILMATVPGKPIWRLFFKIFLEQPATMLKVIFNFKLLHLVNSTEKASGLLFSDDLAIEKREAYSKRLGGESFIVMVFDFLLSKIKRRKNLTIPVLVQCAGKDNMISTAESEYTREFQQADYQFYKELAHNVMLESKWRLSAQGALNWLSEQFPNIETSENISTKKPTLKTEFPDAIQDLIINLGENNEMDGNDTKIGRSGESNRNN